MTLSSYLQSQRPQDESGYYKCTPILWELLIDQVKKLEKEAHLTKMVRQLPELIGNADCVILSVSFTGSWDVYKWSGEETCEVLSEDENLTCWQIPEDALCQAFNRKKKWII